MNFNIPENIPLFLESLEIIGPGYLGIFIVMIVLIAIISLLNKFSNRK